MLQNLFGEHAGATDCDTPVHQVDEDVLRFLADCDKVFELHNQLAAMEFRPGLFARRCQLGCPGGNQPALHDNPELFLPLDIGDL